MPTCGRIKDFELDDDKPRQFRVTVHDFSDDIPFDDYVSRAFPEIEISSHERLSRVFFVSVPHSVLISDLERLLSLLKTSVTILDDADESHALGMHWYSRVGRTALGELVLKSKSYGPASGDRAAAEQLARRMLNWVRDHPPYASADVVAAVPPGNRDKAYDLPQIIASAVAAEFSMTQCRISSTNTTPQKTLTGDENDVNIAGAFRVRDDLRGLRVVLIDDLYRFGRTMNEGVRALRAAGAGDVFALAASKTTEAVDGLYAYSDKWEDQREETPHPTERADLPFE